MLPTRESSKHHIIWCISLGLSEKKAVIHSFDEITYTTTLWQNNNWEKCDFAMQNNNNNNKILFMNKQALQIILFGLPAS